MDTAKLDELRANYKAATEQWITAIRAEEALATEDHSIVAMEKWDSADFAQQDAQKKANVARDLYKSELRKIDYGF